MAAAANSLHATLVLLGAVLLLSVPVESIRFTIDRKECFFEEVKYDGDLVTGSFVITDTDTDRWDWSNVAVDLTVEAPAGYPVYTAAHKTEEKFTFTAVRKGTYKFCFVNKSPVHETIVFEVHVGHIPSSEHAKDEHFDPVEAAIYRVQEAIYQVQFEQHWITSSAERHEHINKTLNRRVLYKAGLETLALIGASVLQVYLLRRLFEKKFTRRMSQV